MTLAVYRPRGQVWACDVGPTPPGDVTVPYLGFAQDTVDRFSGMSGVVGGLLVRRSYNGLADGVPSSWSASAAKDDAALGVQISYLSIKTDPAATARGDFDAKLNAFAKTVPAGSYLTWYPEGEAKRHGNDPAAFRQALQRVYQVVKAANSQVFVGPCFMTYTLTAAANNDITQWFVPPLNASGDFVAWDGYNEAATNWLTFRQVFTDAVAWTRANSDLPFVVAETNTVADPANLPRRSQWWAGVYDYAVTVGMPIVSGWQGAAFPQYDVYQPDDVDALAAISTLNAQTKAARS